MPTPRAQVRVTRRTCLDQGCVTTRYARLSLTNRGTNRANIAAEQAAQGVGPGLYPSRRRTLIGSVIAAHASRTSTPPAPRTSSPLLCGRVRRAAAGGDRETQCTPSFSDTKVAEDDIEQLLDVDAPADPADLIRRGPQLLRRQVERRILAERCELLERLERGDAGAKVLAVARARDEDGLALGGAVARLHELGERVEEGLHAVLGRARDGILPVDREH
eukprot:6112285-Prymnesium_polylepis.1